MRSPIVCRAWPFAALCRYFPERRRRRHPLFSRGKLIACGGALARDSRGKNMQILQAAALSALLLALCVFVHYEAFGCISGRFGVAHVKDRRLVLEVVAIALVAHVAEMMIFGFGYFVADAVLHIGDFAGNRDPKALDYVYFSMETYTSLGLGDIHPTGPMRLMVGIETLGGLMMIGWSTTFTYLSMRRFWDVKAD
jgi:hypothetical protein